MTSSNSSRFDVYEAITNQIITAIEAGAGQVQLPWHRQGSAIYRPVNIASGKAYRGVNTVALWAAADALSFGHGIWGTYRQWQERGAQVRKGEKSSLVIFYKELESGSADQSSDDDGAGNRRFMARASRVFNIAQVDGYAMPEVDEFADRIDPCVAAEAFVAGTAAKISVGGDSAYPPRPLPIAPVLRISVAMRTEHDLSGFWTYPCEPPSFPTRARGRRLFSNIFGGLHRSSVPVISLAENKKYSRLQARGANFPDAH